MVPRRRTAVGAAGGRRRREVDAPEQGALVAQSIKTGAVDGDIKRVVGCGNDPLIEMLRHTGDLYPDTGLNAPAAA